MNCSRTTIGFLFGQRVMVDGNFISLLLRVISSYYRKIILVYIYGQSISNLTSRYGPAYTAFFQQQNQKIANGSLTENGDTFVIHLDTLGIINGCVDMLTQELSYAQMAFNNTYNLQTINETVYNQAVAAFSQSGGCKDRIVNCRTTAAEGDPTNQGNNETVNAACRDANDFCSETIEEPFQLYSGKNFYDIAAPTLGKCRLSNL
jgi:hypothetical protein